MKNYYDEMRVQLVTARNVNAGKPIANNTRLYQEDDDCIVLALHGHKIIYYYADGSIKLDACGYRTHTTKERMNRFTPFHITQENYVWYIEFVNVVSGKHDVRLEYVFSDGMTFIPNGSGGYTASHESRQEESYDSQHELIKSIDKYATKFAEALPVDLPTGGDCWYCALKTAHGVSLGDSQGNTGHLEAHIEENYFVPSLLLGAVREANWTEFRIQVSNIFKHDFVDRNISKSDRSLVKRAIKTYMIKRLVHNYQPATC